VTSPRDSEQQPLELDRDVPTTREDIEVLGRLRRERPSWLMLSAAEIEALLPEGALDRRPATPPGAQPFTLP
jgi:hypothetical protein